MNADSFPRASESFKAANPHIFEKGTLGQVMLEPEEREPTKEEAKSEKQLQGQIRGFLERNGTVVIQSRTDKATTTNLGTPDLIFALKGRPVAFEVKLPGRKATKAQHDMMERMSNNGWLCFLIHSYDKAVEQYQKLILQFALDSR